MPVKISRMNKFYITTAIPYVNAPPHVGHALEFVQADVTARYRKLIGSDVLLLSGGDENALKNVQAAEEANVPVQEFVDRNSLLFEHLAKRLNVGFDVFQKGSSRQHHESSQKLWEACAENGDIYKKNYSGLYCVGCESFYERSELNEKGECFEHPGKKLQEVQEKNYFFRLSKYQKQIEQILENDELKIIPNFRKNEVLNFVKQGLKDISISRSNERAKNWGVPVPGDNTQRMYVWFDALNIYRSGVEERKDRDWWPADLHVIGKGITRFHAVYWPAFLLSAGLKLPKSLFVHGYFTVEGQKMSKTIGNVIDPSKLIDQYGTDGLRYYLLAEIPSTSDGDFSERRLKEVYNADLANGLGNLVSRVARLFEKVEFEIDGIKPALSQDIAEFIEEFKFNEGLSIIWRKIASTNHEINQEEPWKLTEDALADALIDYVNSIIQIATDLRPFLPETSEKILKQFSGKIKSSTPLFPRLS